MFHRHKWIEVKRYFVPSPSREVKLKHASDELIQEITYGLTSIELKCDECGDITSRKILGDAT